MSSIGICEYCKHIDKDITEKPCLHCSANMGAFEFDISEHDAKVRADAIDECTKAITNFCGGLPNNNLISALEQLKEQI